ncbi:hypothetical protein [Streptomyces sp. NPDC087437]|uniref:hypothetical protein n=1 Tax=Streptomyces sp. NPDC087437 TaxID=3365789 RepID=UPI00381B0C14
MSEMLPGMNSDVDMTGAAGEGRKVGRGRAWLLVAAGAAVIAVGAGALWLFQGGRDADPGDFTLRGRMVLNYGATTATFEYGGDCSGYDGSGYGDIVPGASVTVYDSSGSVVATGELGKGKLPEGSTSSVPCTFPLVVKGVPKGSRFYQVEVSHRGRVTVPAADAEAGRFAASLGSGR